MTLEVALGRWLAWAAHPERAWPRVGPCGRAAIVAAYVGAGYVLTLLVLASTQ
jgi:hypothetical protein